MNELVHAGALADGTARADGRAPARDSGEPGPPEDTFVDIDFAQRSKQGQYVSGDVLLTRRWPAEGRIISVLADGLGVGGQGVGVGEPDGGDGAEVHGGVCGHPAIGAHDHGHAADLRGAQDQLLDLHGAGSGREWRRQRRGARQPPLGAAARLRGKDPAQAIVHGGTMAGPGDHLLRFPGAPGRPAGVVFPTG